MSPFFSSLPISFGSQEQGTLFDGWGLEYQDIDCKEHTPTIPSVI